MLDIVLEERYPRSVVLDDESAVTVRPMVKEDCVALTEFFSKVPERDRIFLQHNVRDPEVIAAWCEGLNYQKILPLLAFDGNKVIANASLKQQKTGWMSHIGNVRIVVDNSYRGKGLGRKLVEELIYIALNTGLAKLQAEFMADQKLAIETFQRLGFVSFATIPEYVWDQNGVPRDYVLMVYDMRDKEYFPGD